MGTLPYYQIGMALVIAVFCVLLWFQKLPSVESLQNLANTVNTKGGNILTLAFFTILFFFTGLGFAYWTLNRMIEGKLSADNAIVMTGMQWIMGAAFGGSFSSMLKVMSGENPEPVVKTAEKTTVSAEVTGDGK